ncbi:hypothetical protein ALI144C_16480 [Actinosynnema sp. ALI-1.44]|nr:hypothetical protein ALI144C_16480 [Actinosynnema sp. ALI-1.44]
MQPGGAYPQSGPQPQPGYDPNNPYAQQQQPGMYGQQPPYGQPGYPPPKKSPLPWILVGGAVVVIGVVLVLIFTLGGSGGGTGSPSATANTMVDAINNKDKDAAEKVACEKGKVNTKKLDSLPATVQYKASVSEEPKENGDSATGKIKLDITAEGQSISMTMTFTLKKKDSDWCLSNISDPKMDRR